jgi:cyclophilin family peptidyl-prolyl cis-trans isomerase
MPKRTRDRQLAKLAARRQAEREAAKRRRTLMVGGIAVIVTLLLVAVAGALLLKDSEPSTAAATGATPSAASPTAANATVACGAEAPAGAGEKKPTFADPPPDSIDPNQTYTATIATSCGAIEVDLLAKTATEAVNSFVFLANQGFYDGLTWHRLVQDFVIQGGDPAGDGTGGPGYETPVTVTKGSSFDGPGVVAYAHSATGGNGSQFFITLAATPSLDPPQGKYTIFGTVTKGQDVVDEIAAIPTTPNPQGEPSVPSQTVYIDSITIA